MNDKLYEITAKKDSYGRPRRQTSKALNFTKLNLTHDDFTVFSQFLGKFEIYQFFSDSHKKLSLVLLQITNYIYRP